MRLTKFAATPARRWVLLGLMLLMHDLYVSHATQSTTGLLMVSMVWVGALICIEDQVPELAIAPSMASMVLGASLIALGLLRSRMTHNLDVVQYLIPPVLGLGMALLAAPVRSLSRFYQPLMVLFLLPVFVAVWRMAPEEALSHLTAKFSEMLLSAAGQPAHAQGRLLQLPQGGVRVAASCNGIDLIVQVLLVSCVFVIAFRPRTTVSILMLIAVAPLFGFIGNCLRISLLAVIVSSNLESRQALFKFLHDENGSLVFAGLTVGLYGYVYYKVIDRQLRALEATRSQTLQSATP